MNEDDQTSVHEQPEELLSEARPWCKMGHVFLRFFLKCKPCWGRGGCRDVPPRDQSQPEKGVALRSLRAPSSLGPTLHHQPRFPHSTAHTVLGNAEIVAGILWAGMDNPQLSAG